MCIHNLGGLFVLCLGTQRCNFQAFSWGLCRTIVYANVVYFIWIRITVGLTMNLILSPTVVVASIVRMMGETSSWPLSIMGHWSWVKTEYAREFLMNEMPENFRIELFNRHTIKWNVNKCFLLLLLCLITVLLFLLWIIILTLSPSWEIMPTGSTCTTNWRQVFAGYASRRCKQMGPGMFSQTSSVSVPSPHLIPIWKYHQSFN